MVAGMKDGVKTAILEIAACICAFALVVGLSGCALTTPSRAEVEPDPIDPVLSSSDLVKDGYLTVAMDASDAPQTLIDADGKPSGYYGDIALAFAERFGLKLQVISASSAEESVGKGKADIFIGVKSNELPEGNLATVGALLDNGSAVFAKTADGSNEVPTLSAQGLSGATVAVQDASASQDALMRAGVDANFKTCENVNKCFEALANEEVKYVACDATAGSYLARAYPGVVFVGTISSISSYGIALSGDNTALATAVNDAYQDMLDGGVIEAIHRCWYGGMPLSLADSLLSGIVLTTPSQTADEDGAADGEETDEAPTDGETGDGYEVGGDINSLD